MQTKKMLIVAGVGCLFYVAWQLDALYIPPVNQFSTPPNATAIDARLLAGSRHVAPLAHKKWLEEQMETQMKEANGECTEPGEDESKAIAAAVAAQPAVAGTTTMRAGAGMVSSPADFGIAAPRAEFGTASQPAGAGVAQPPAGAGFAQPLVPPSYQYAPGSYQASNTAPALGKPEQKAYVPIVPSAEQPAHFHVMSGNHLRLVVRR